MASVAAMKSFFLLVLLLFTVNACAQDSLRLDDLGVADKVGSPAPNPELDEIDEYLSKLRHILPRAETVTVVSTDTICSSELVPTPSSGISVTHQTSAVMPSAPGISETPEIPVTSAVPGTTSAPVEQSTTVISGIPSTTLTSEVAPTTFTSAPTLTASPPLSSAAHSVTPSREPSFTSTTTKSSTRHSTTSGPTTTAPRTSHTSSAPAPSPNAATAQRRVDMMCLAIVALSIRFLFV